MLHLSGDTEHEGTRLQDAVAGKPEQLPGHTRVFAPHRGRRTGGAQLRGRDRVTVALAWAPCSALRTSFLTQRRTVCVKTQEPDVRGPHDSPTLGGPPWGPGQGRGLGGHLLTICPAGSTCSPVSLEEKEGAAEGRDSTGWPGRLSAAREAGRTAGSTPGPPQGSGDCGPAPPPPADALTVAVREAGEALGTRVAALAREVGPAVAAAGQVLTRPVREVRLAAAAWAGTGGS